MAMYFGVRLPQYSNQEWRKHFRMYKDTLEYIVTELRPLLRKQTTRFGHPIHYRKRLAAVIWWLATPTEYRSLASKFGIGISTLCGLTRQVCHAIKQTFMHQYISLLSGNRLIDTVEGFPQCAGVIDGTHLPVIAPHESPVDYHNRKVSPISTSGGLAGHMMPERLQTQTCLQKQSIVGLDFCSGRDMASMNFRYSTQDFVSKVPKEADCDEKYSRFDKELRARWDEAVDKGYFRYELGSLPMRIIDGPHGFVAQLNIKRATDRRKPQEIKSTKQPFRPDEFNFNKVKPHEVIMEMEPEGLSPLSKNGISNRLKGLHAEEEGCINGEGRGKFQVIINISPLEYGNVLLVPSPHLCQPQIATMEMIHIGVEAVLLSSSSAFRIGYNSLCAYASVNHLHMHAYYADYRLPAEYWPTKEMVGGRVHETIGWPAQGFMVQLKKENYLDGIRDLFMMVKYLQDKDIAHNMFFTRGLTLGPNPQADGQTIRLFLWPRISSYGVKANDAFNGACCELSGHLPIKRDQRYKDLTDEQCCALLETNSLPPEDYASLKKDIKNLFK